MMGSVSYEQLCINTLPKLGTHLAPGKRLTRLWGSVQSEKRKQQKEAEDERTKVMCNSLLNNLDYDENIVTFMAV
eukprot:5636691-Ditylum_brightwellii.AAC.1